MMMMMMMMVMMVMMMMMVMMKMMMKVMMMMSYLRANAVDLEVSPGGECSESEATKKHQYFGETFFSLVTLI